MVLVLANMMTPLMSAATNHLLFGNVVIGLIEGLLIARLFKTSIKRACLIMILANYASMVPGLLLVAYLAPVLSSLWVGDCPLIYHATLLHVTLGLFAFGVTILIEWPFCRWIMRKQPQANKKAWKASAIAQVVSYSLLVPLYWAASETGLVSDMTLHDDVAFVRLPIATVYYINPEDGAVWRIQTDGTGRERVLDAKIPTGSGPLDFVLSEDGSSWDLTVRDEPAPFGGNITRLAAAFTTGRAFDNLVFNEEGLPFRPLTVPSDLRSEADPAWTIEVDIWGGFFVRDKGHSSARFRIAFAFPWFRLPALSPTILTSEQVVFELDGYIMLLDLQTRDLGVLTRGRGPAVIEPGETFNTWVDPRSKAESPEADTGTAATKGASMDAAAEPRHPTTASPTTVPADAVPAAGG